MFVSRSLLPLLAVTLAMANCDTVCGDGYGEASSSATDQPFPLDLSDHLPDQGDLSAFKDFVHRQVVDGMPFQIEGPITLYGTTPAERGNVHREAAQDIPVGRALDELHLIHYTHWPDVHGEVVAFVCMNYADDTMYAFPIRYGHHVRDWFNLPSYQTETVDDPNTTICWRRSPIGYKAPVRVFKSTFENPFPDKRVTEIDIVSNGKLAAYNLLAATASLTTDRNQEDVEFQNRDFDAKVTITVVDQRTGKPIEDVLVMPSMTVEGEGVVGTPVRTSAEGMASIPYPTADTEGIWASVSKPGYSSASESWRVPAPEVHTYELRRTSNE